MARVLGYCTYRGTNFAGWQIQPHQDSVEEYIERALSQVLNQPIYITGSGRTDSGVHALSQPFHFDLEKKVDLKKMVYALNCLLPEDIRINKMKYVDSSFHARINAKAKEYVYYLQLSSKDPFVYDKVYLCPYHLNVKAMAKAIKLFIGKHNFSCFTSKTEDFVGFMREIYSVNIKFDKERQLVIFTFKGNGFMRYMVRYMVGTLIEIGRGKIDSTFIPTHLDQPQRAIISFKAPPQGLYLKKVYY